MTTTTNSVIDVDPRTLLVEVNVRTDAALDPDFVASIRDLGVLTPVLVHRGADGLRVRAGQRRTLAAIEAGRATIPALVLDGDDDQVRRIVEQWSENHHRRALSTADDAAAFEQLSLLGLSPTQIAKRTRAKKAHVTTALAVSASDLATAAAARYDLTLEQAAVLAEFDDDHETVKTLTVTAVKEPERFAHVAQQARDQRTRAAEVAALVDDLTTQGFAVVDNEEAMTRLGDLRAADGTTITEDTHANCPARAALVQSRWSGLYVIYGCTDPGDNGHSPAHTNTDPAADDVAAKEAAKAERRRVIENNKAWRSAEVVRREWLAEFAKRKTAPTDAAAYLATTLTTTGAVFDLDKAGSEDRHALARTWLGLPEAPGGYYAGPDDAFATAVAKTSPTRALMITLAVSLAATEAQTGVHTWRHPSTHIKAYLTALTRWGYGLSEVEAEMLQPAAPEAQ